MSLDLSYTPAEDGPTVRFLSTLAAPVFPLVVLLCCFLVELVKPGLGITAALQAQSLQGHTPSQTLIPSFVSILVSLTASGESA